MICTVSGDVCVGGKLKWVDMPLWDGSIGSMVGQKTTGWRNKEESTMVSISFSLPTSPYRIIRSLEVFDLQELHFEFERRVAWDNWGEAASSICLGRAIG